MTMNNVNLEAGTADIAEYSATEAALAMLREKYSVVPDANTDEGYALVKAGIKELTTLRTSLEAARKREKEPHLQAGRIIDAEAKRITEELVKLEDPMKAAKKEVDDRIERERQERIARLQVKVDAIVAMPGQVRGKSSQEIASMLDRVGEIDAMHDYYDLTKEAVAARENALSELAQMLTDRLAFEASEEDRKKAEAEKAALEQQLAEQRAEMQRQQDELNRQQREMAAQREELERQRAELQAKADPVPTAEPIAEPEPKAKAEPTAPAPAAKPAAVQRCRGIVTELIADEMSAAGLSTNGLLVVSQDVLDRIASELDQVQQAA